MISNTAAQISVSMNVVTNIWDNESKQLNKMYQSSDYFFRLCDVEMLHVMHLRNTYKSDSWTECVYVLG